MLPPTSDEGVWLGPLLTSCIRLLPHRGNFGGFFVAAFRRVELPRVCRAVDAACGTACAAAVSVTDSCEVNVTSEAERDRHSIASFYGVRLDHLPGHLVQIASRRLPRASAAAAPSNAFSISACSASTSSAAAAPDIPRRAAAPRAARHSKQDKFYLVGSGLAALLYKGETVMAAGELGAAGDNLLSVGVKAFERLKVTHALQATSGVAMPMETSGVAVPVHADDQTRDSVWSEIGMHCEWRLCQEGLAFIVPFITRRHLVTASASFFSSVLRAGTLRIESLLEHVARGEVGGLETCRGLAQNSSIETGGAVLTLELGNKGPSNSQQASVVVVINVGWLAVWTPRDEVKGMLALLAPLKAATCT